MWLFLAFLAVPLIEIALFVQVGGVIGLWSTLAIVVLTAIIGTWLVWSTLAIVVLTVIIGTWLVRSQGIMALNNLRNSFSELQDPAEPLAHGAMILFAGALLLTPGFFTDAVGFALLIPAVRSAAFRALRKRMQIHTFSMGPQPHPTQRHPSQPDIIEGEFTEIEPDKKPTHPAASRTKH